MARNFKMWLISFCTIALASVSVGCLGGGGQPYYGSIGYDSQIILSYDKTVHAINNSVYSSLVNQINATGIQVKTLFDYYVPTVCFDNSTEKSNHLGGGIYVNFSKWVEIRHSYDHRTKSSDFPYVNDTRSAVVIDTCYLTDKHFSASKNLTNISEPYRLKLVHYNDILTEILHNTIDAKMESENYTSRGKLMRDYID